MFLLRIHSVDTEHSLATDYSDYTPQSLPKFAERRGIVHLFRSLSHAPLSSPSSRSTNLFVVAVPNYFSSDDFIRFCGSHIDHISQLLFIRNDGIEDRYSVLIKLVDQMKADGFYCTFNGKNFSPSEAEICHILFMVDLEYTESADTASTPPPGFTELPTCPVCLERLDPDTSGILSTNCDHSFHCSCGTKWTYLSCQVCQLCQQKDEVPTCFICGTMENLWICVICGFVGCGRYKEKHAISHWKNMQHCYSLELRTQQIWDYVGDIYVHRLNHSKADGKISEMNSGCESFEGDCGTCDYSEDSGISGALLNSKVEAIFDEYNHLLATQLETQRQYYESQLLEEKNRKESYIKEAVEGALTSRMQEIHNNLDTCVHEKKAVAEINENLVRKQDVLRKKVKEVEERESSRLKLKDEKIHDLEEQIRDLMVYIEAQKALHNMKDEDGVRGGTLLPVQSSTSTRRQPRFSRRRR
ncbi:hypothetical protein SAY86_030244 [Trapa natans]|uniref:BRCA1-associated protein n=1 Tax=Trapa natans TaxID=22666 RepID=A0AAN7MQX7_TRANT|nr:hypothetical protein SAY86_030244 [Trapa natans]